jgi:exosortase/archaeosortase family protein
LSKLKVRLLSIKNTSLAWRIFAFFALFIIISGTLGPMIINHSLVGKFGFQIYGGMGKALIFAAIVFGLLVWRGGRPLPAAPWRPRSALWLAPAVGGYALAYIAITHLQQGLAGVLWPALAHIGIVLTIACTALAAIGLTDIKNITRTYKRELLTSVAIGVGFYIFLTLVYGLWEYLSTAVMYSVRWLLMKLNGLTTYIVPPRTIVLSKFGVEISQFCSGIESIALFTGFYAIVGVIDRQRLNFKRYAALFLPALLLIFVCNILRVYVLIAAAYYINPHIAFTLFHTYAGMIFFIVYTAVFWAVSYRWMLKNEPIAEKIKSIEA